MSMRSSERLVMRFTSTVNTNASAAEITYVIGSTSTSKYSDGIRRIHVSERASA